MRKRERELVGGLRVQLRVQLLTVRETHVCPDGSGGMAVLQEGGEGGLAHRSQRYAKRLSSLRVLQSRGLILKLPEGH